MFIFLGIGKTQQWPQGWCTKNNLFLQYDLLSFWTAQCAAFSIVAPCLWNLPLRVRTAPSLSIFKTCLLLSFWPSMRLHLFYLFFTLVFIFLCFYAQHFWSAGLFLKCFINRVWYWVAQYQNLHLKQQQLILTRSLLWTEFVAFDHFLTHLLLLACFSNVRSTKDRDSPARAGS